MFYRASNFAARRSELSTEVYSHRSEGGFGFDNGSEEEIDCRSVLVIIARRVSGDPRFLKIWDTWRLFWTRVGMPGPLRSDCLAHRRRSTAMAIIRKGINMSSSMYF